MTEFSYFVELKLFFSSSLYVSQHIHHSTSLCLNKTPSPCSVMYHTSLSVSAKSPFSLIWPSTSFSTSQMDHHAFWAAPDMLSHGSHWVMASFNASSCRAQCYSKLLMWLTHRFDVIICLSVAALKSSQHTKSFQNWPFQPGCFEVYSTSYYRTVWCPFDSILLNLSLQTWSISHLFFQLSFL